ncbi:MAG: cytochrome c biogenesis protein CcsA [Eggerthellaceae bacterium]|nr:cytochrome c biogenesis protein CcsA [Eggerthellaceae bacterium]
MVPFVLTIASITLYVLSATLGVYAMVRKVDRVVLPSKAVFLAALVAQSVAIGINSVSTSGTLMSGPNIIMLAAWVLALVAFLLAAVGKRSHAFIAFAGPIAAVLIVASQVLGVLEAGASPSNEVYYEWPTLVLHVSLILLGTAAFAVSASASVMRVYQSELMKRRSDRLLRIGMPAVSTLSAVARRAAMVGMTLFSAGILIGLARFLALYAVMSAVDCEGSLLYLVPRMALSLVVWAIYAVYLVLSYIFPYVGSSKLRAGFSIAGLVLAIVLIVVSAG